MSDLYQIFRKPYLSVKDHDRELVLVFDLALHHDLDLDLYLWRITCPQPPACLIFSIAAIIITSSFCNDKSLHFGVKYHSLQTYPYIFVSISDRYILLRFSSSSISSLSTTIKSNFWETFTKIFKRMEEQLRWIWSSNISNYFYFVFDMTYQL